MFGFKRRCKCKHRLDASVCNNKKNGMKTNADVDVNN